jgi:hypothetical protein
MEVEKQNLMPRSHGMVVKKDNVNEVICTNNLL